MIIEFLFISTVPQQRNSKYTVGTNGQKLHKKQNKQNTNNNNNKLSTFWTAPFHPIYYITLLRKLMSTELLQMFWIAKDR